MRTEHPEKLGERERELIGELYPSLRRFASAVRPPGEDGNDLVQEALLRTIRSKGSLMGLDNPGAYVRRTIVNLAKDLQRSEARRQTAWSTLGRERHESPT